MYRIDIKPRETSFMAKTCHSCKKIVLSGNWLRLDEVRRDLVLEHEKSHALDKSSCLVADARAVVSVSKKYKKNPSDLVKLLRLMGKDEKHINELKKLIL